MRNCGKPIPGTGHGCPWMVPCPIAAHREPSTTFAGGLVAPLPAWCYSVAYRSESDVIEMKVARVPVTGTMPMTYEECAALVEALQQCLTQSERAAAVLDVPSP